MHLYRQRIVEVGFSKTHRTPRCCKYSILHGSSDNNVAGTNGPKIYSKLNPPKIQTDRVPKALTDATVAQQVTIQTSCK